METIPKADCSNIGFIRKAHGVHGKVVLEFESHYEFSVEEAKRFFVELDGLLVPFFLKENGMRITSSKSAILDLDFVEDEKYAKRLLGKQVFLFNYEIIDEEEEFTESSLVGFRLLDKTIGEIGNIVEVNDYSGNVVLTVIHKGEDVLIPFNEELLISVDEENKILIINVPKGII